MNEPLSDGRLATLRQWLGICGASAPGAAWALELLAEVDRLRQCGSQEPIRRLDRERHTLAEELRALGKNVSSLPPLAIRDQLESLAGRVEFRSRTPPGFAPSEAAWILEVSEDVVRDWIDAGELKQDSSGMISWLALREFMRRGERD